MAHTQAHTQAYVPQFCERFGFWFAETTRGICIAIGDTRTDVQKQIDLFLGRK